MTSTDAINIAGAYYLPREVRQIIRLLDNNPMPVCDIAAHLNDSAPTVRQKLNRWKAVGFICITGWTRINKVLKPMYGLGNKDVPKPVRRVPDGMTNHVMVGYWGL